MLILYFSWVHKILVEKYYILLRHHFCNFSLPNALEDTTTQNIFNEYLIINAIIFDYQTVYILLHSCGVHVS